MLQLATGQQAAVRDGCRLPRRPSRLYRLRRRHVRLCLAKSNSRKAPLYPLTTSPQIKPPILLSHPTL